MTTATIVLLSAILSSCSAAAGALAATSIDRMPAGAMLGLLLGPFGVLLVAAGVLTPQSVLDARKAERQQARLEAEAAARAPRVIR